MCSSDLLSKVTYQEALQESVFALAPRGDNKFSYRFTELMSAGAIPVVHADDWVWPFRPELVDWDKCAVILPEKDAGQFTIDILRNMTIDERCRRRQYCWQIYQNYMEAPVKIIDGLVQGLERVHLRQQAGLQPLPLGGVRCDAFTEDPSECNMMRRR